MKQIYFYLYQIADVVFTSSCRAVGILFVWSMLQYYQLKVQLGWFITAAWIGQVFLLIVMGLYADRIDKKKIPILCSGLSLFCLLLLQFAAHIEPLQLGASYIITALMCIAIQPIGSSIVANLYQGENLEQAYRVRGFVNSINTVLGAAISGFIIQQLSMEHTILSLTIAMAVALILFMQIKTHDLPTIQLSYSNLSAFNSLLNNKVERILLVVAASANFALTPILMYITPILVIEKYHYSAFELGIAEAIFGFGMLIGSLLLCQSMNHWLNVRITTILSILSVAVGILIICLIGYISALFLGLFIAGTGTVIYNINTTKIRCSATPEYMRNSFESLFLALCIIPIPAGVAMTTLMIESGAITQILVIFTLLILLSAIAVWTCKNFDLLSTLNDDELVDYYPQLYPTAYPNK